MGMRGHHRQGKNGPTAEVTVEQLGLAAERVKKRQEDDNESVQSVASSSHKTNPTLLQRLNASEQVTPGTELQMQSNTNEPPPDQWAGMPTLVQNSQADQIRVTYIQQLEMALAALKIPMFNKHSDEQN